MLNIFIPPTLEIWPGYSVNFEAPTNQLEERVPLQQGASRLLQDKGAVANAAHEYAYAAASHHAIPQCGASSSTYKL